MNEQEHDIREALERLAALAPDADEVGADAVELVGLGIDCDQALRAGFGDPAIELQDRVGVELVALVTVVAALLTAALWVASSVATSYDPRHASESRRRASRIALGATLRR